MRTVLHPPRYQHRRDIVAVIDELPGQAKADLRGHLEELTVAEDDASFDLALDDLIERVTTLRRNSRVPLALRLDDLGKLMLNR